MPKDALAEEALGLVGGVPGVEKKGIADFGRDGAGAPLGWVKDADGRVSLSMVEMNALADDMTRTPLFHCGLAEDP